MALSEQGGQRTLVTGGAGFIGSRLVELLVREHHRVVVLDSLLWGADRIAEMQRDKTIELVQGDIRDERTMDVVQRLGPYETVYHLAAIHYIPYCASHPTEALSVNVVGTQAVLEATNVPPPKSFVFASTGDVYAPKGEPHTETDELRPSSIYGLTKVFGEQLLAAAAARSTTTRYSIARFFNVYGSRETNPHVIPEILAQLRGGDRVRLGNTWPRRDYIHVNDVVQALQILAAQSNVGNCEYFNVGTGAAFSVNDIVDSLRKILSRKIIVEVDESRVRKVERPHLQASSQKITETTGWLPRYTLETGLKEVCEGESVVPAA